MSEKEPQTDWRKIADELADALIQERRNSDEPDPLTDTALEAYYSAFEAAQTAFTPNLLPAGETLAELARRDRITAVDIRFCCDISDDGDCTDFMTCAPGEATICTVYGLTDLGEATAVHDVDLPDGDLSEIGMAVTALIAAVWAAREGGGA